MTKIFFNLENKIFYRSTTNQNTSKKCALINKDNRYKKRLISVTVYRKLSEWIYQGGSIFICWIIM